MEVVCEILASKPKNTFVWIRDIDSGDTQFATTSTTNFWDVSGGKKRMTLHTSAVGRRTNIRLSHRWFLSFGIDLKHDLFQQSATSNTSTKNVTLT